MIKTRKSEELPQPLGGINFLAPKSKKSFVKRLKDWFEKQTAKDKGTE